MSVIAVLILQDAMKQLEASQPGRFGPGGGLSVAYSLNNIAWTSGMLIGPIVSGFLVRRFGYYWMNTGLGMLKSTAVIFVVPIADTW